MPRKTTLFSALSALSLRPSEELIRTLTSMSAPIVESDAESVADEAPATAADKAEEAAEETMKADAEESDEEDDDEDEETYVKISVTKRHEAHP